MVVGREDNKAAVEEGARSRVVSSLRRLRPPLLPYVVHLWSRMDTWC